VGGLDGKHPHSNAAKDTTVKVGNSFLVSISVEFAAVAVNITVFAAKLTPLMARAGIVAIVEVTLEFAAITGDLRFIVANVTAQAVITLPSKRGRYAHSD
jgi:hypothetical protein